jgi:uncharacterized protein YdaU (DUF1376 family)
MSLRNQPYIPLYVQDFLTDEKLMVCSASATGIYIRLLCIMHKSEEYGTILLKQKDKQTESKVKNFALKLAKFMPYPVDEIMSALEELLSENVIQNGGDKLMQKRMVYDNDISIKRAEAGKKGGLKTQEFAKAKSKASTEYENEIEYEDEIKDVAKKIPPKIEDVKTYCKERNNNVDPDKWFDFYTSKGWMVGKNKMKDWKAAVRTWEDKKNNRPQLKKL